MKKALYLSDKIKLDIQIDGPSLLISVDNKAPRRVPFGYLDRVYIIGNFSLSSELLCAFGQYNIPVLIYQSEKKPIGIMMPFSDDFSRFTIRLIKSLSDYDNREVLNNWYRSMKRRYEIIFIKKYIPGLLDLFSRRGILTEDMENLTRNLIEPLDYEYYKKLFSYLMLIHYEFVLVKLKESSLDFHIGIKNRREDFGMVKDMCEITEPLIASIIIDILKSKGGIERLSSASKVLTSDIRGILVKKYESRKSHLSFEVDIILDHLFRYLREISI